MSEKAEKAAGKGRKEYPKTYSGGSRKKIQC
jgi:hypothetical protein